MSRYSSPQLITPPREEEEVYPYRRVWPSLILQISGLFVITLGLYIGTGVIGLNLPPRFWQPANAVLALSPALLWGVFAFWRERRVEQPRRPLLGVFVVAALVANAVGLPVINALEPAAWLPLSGTFQRILGYAFTVGIIHETLKYLVMRFMVWPEGFRIRLDTLAYSTAAAIGYVTIINLHTLNAGTPSPDVFMARVFGDTMLHLAATSILAYGLAQLRFTPQFYIALPLSLAAAAFLIGLGTTFRSGIVNAGFTLGISSTRPLFGIGFSLVLITATLVVIAFLYNTSERRAVEAAEGSEEAA